MPHRKVTRLLVIFPVLLALFSVPGARGQATIPVCPVASTGFACGISILPATVRLSLTSPTTVGVYVDDVDSLSTFDVYVNYNPAFLSASNIVTGDLAADPSLYWCGGDCVNLATIAADITQSTGTIHVVQGLISGLSDSVATPLLLFTVDFAVSVPATSSLTVPTTDPTGAPNPKFSECPSGPGSCVSYTASTISNAQAIIPHVSIDFTPSTLTIPQGSAGEEADRSLVTLSSVSGFNGTLQLSALSSESTNYAPGARLSRYTVSVSVTRPSMSVVLRAEAQPCTPPGLYHVLVRATNGTLTESGALDVVVIPATNNNTFCINASSNSVGTLTAGSSSSVAISVCSSGLASDSFLIVRLQADHRDRGPRPHVTRSVNVTSANDCATGTPLSSTLRISANTRTTKGPFAVVVTGTGASGEDEEEDEGPQFFVVVTGTVA